MVDCGCRLGFKCSEHEYCADGAHRFDEYSYDRARSWFTGARRSFTTEHVTVRSCQDCDRHESEIVGAS